MVFIVDAVYDSSTSWVASAAYCRTVNKRPTMGVIRINLAHTEMSENNKYYYMLVMLHELFHIMGFDITLFQDLGMTTTKHING